MTKAKENPSDYYLDRLQDLPSINKTREANAAAWRNFLSVEEYVEREHVLGLSKIASSETNRVLVFGLKNKSDPSTIVSSVELLVRESWRFHKTADGSVARKSVLSGCVGGVYTDPSHRGKGYASIMIDKLMQIAKTPDVLGEDGFVFLYSEVGEYYARNGFKSFHVPLANIPLVAQNKPYEKPENVDLVKYHEFAPLFEEYNAHFDSEMREKTATDGLDRITINPTADYIDWYHLRLKFFVAKLYEQHIKFDGYRDSYDDLVAKFLSIQPHYYGMILRCPETGDSQGFIVWHYEYDFDKETEKPKNYVTILKIHVDTTRANYDSVAVQLIANLKNYVEADHGIPQLANFHKIVLWESEVSSKVLRDLRKFFQSVDGLNNSSLGAICFVNEEDDSRLKKGEILWENNNKLPWF